MNQPAKLCDNRAGAFLRMERPRFLIFDSAFPSCGLQGNAGQIAALVLKVNFDFHFIDILKKLLQIPYSTAGAIKRLPAMQKLWPLGAPYSQEPLKVPN